MGNVQGIVQGEFSGRGFPEIVDGQICSGAIIREEVFTGNVSGNYPGKLPHSDTHTHTHTHTQLLTGYTISSAS